MWVHCFFTKSCLVAARPRNPAYPEDLVTLGDYLRKTRLDRSMTQPEVARLLGVTTETVIGMELNRYEPRPRTAQKVIEYLGFIPTLYGTDLKGKLRLARMVAGMTQEEVAGKIGCDESTIRNVELGKRKIQARVLNLICGFIDSSFENSIQSMSIGSMHAE